MNAYYTRKSFLKIRDIFFERYVNLFLCCISGTMEHTHTQRRVLFMKILDEFFSLFKHRNTWHFMYDT